MLCVYDMVEAKADEQEGVVRPVAEILQNLREWAVPRLQEHDFRSDKKVVLPPCGLPH